MAPMNGFFVHLLHFFHLDEPGQGSTDNGPLGSVLRRLEDFFQRLSEHFPHHHPHPCPPDTPSGSGDDTNHPTTPAGGDGNHQPGNDHSSDDGTPEGTRCNPACNPDQSAHDDGPTGTWPRSGFWTNHGSLPSCNAPGLGNTDHG